MNNITKNSKKMTIPSEFFTSNAHFGKSLYLYIREEFKENVIISPSCIAFCLGLFYFGAVDKTKEELEEALRFPNKTGEDIQNFFKYTIAKLTLDGTISIANSIFVSDSIELKQEYKQIAQSVFRVKPKTIDFGKSDEAATTMNNWIAQQTNNKIKNLLTADMVENIKVCVVSAVYFKAKWKLEFDSDETTDSEFWISESESKTVRMMQSQGEYKLMQRCEALNASILELDYDSSNNLSMMFIVPTERTGITSLENKLDAFNILCGSKSLKKQQCKIALPRFKVETSCINLQNALMKMGLANFFNNGNFSRMYDSKDQTETTNIFHKVVVEVNEEGTEAAAATAGIIALRQLNPQLIIDRPFIFIIKSKLNILFVGKYVGE